MSTLRKGNPSRGPPKHQNKFAFRHNKNSKKTKMIKKIAHDGLCKRCADKIEWRKKYRKYKPLTAPAICNGCKQRNVKRAYHTLCESCAGGKGICAKCMVVLPDEGQNETDDTNMEVEKPSHVAKKESMDFDEDDDDDYDEDNEDDENEDSKLEIITATKIIQPKHPIIHPSSDKTMQNMQEEDDEEDGDEEEEEEDDDDEEDE